MYCISIFPSSRSFYSVSFDRVTMYTRNLFPPDSASIARAANDNRARFIDAPLLQRANTSAVNVHSSNPRPRPPCVPMLRRRIYATDGKNEEDGRKDVSHKYACRSWNVGRGAAREEEFPVANERWDASVAALFASQVRATRASTN